MGFDSKTFSEMQAAPDLIAKLKEDNQLMHETLDLVNRWLNMDPLPGLNLTHIEQAVERTMKKIGPLTRK